MRRVRRFAFRPTFLAVLALRAASPIGNLAVFRGPAVITFGPCFARHRDVPGEERLIICTFLTLQMLDGTMTYAGVRLLGPHVEMNAVLAWYMDVLGVGATIALAKLLACGCGCLLYCRRWHRTLAALSGLYLGVAIVPWMVALLG